MKISTLGEAAPKVSPKVSAPVTQQQAKPAAEAGERSPFQRLIDGLGKEISSGERTVKGALAAGGGDMKPVSCSRFKRVCIATAKRSISRRSSSIARRAA